MHSLGGHALLALAQEDAGMHFSLKHEQEEQWQAELVVVRC